MDLIYDNPKHVYRSYLFPSIVSALLSGLFLLLLPVFFGMTGVWIAQPLAEALTAALAFFFLFHSPVDRSQA